MTRAWLTQLRIQAEKTHEDVASAVDVSRQYYGMIESGIRNPSVELAKRISTVLNFEWTLFFADQGNEMLPCDQSTKDTA